MRLDHLLSKDRSKGCVSGKLSCVKNPAPREMEDIGRGTGSPEDGSHLPGRTRREAPQDGISPKCGAFRDCAGSNRVKFVWWRCAQGQHPFSSRTRRLRPDRPKVLCWRRHGRIGGRRINGGIAQVGEHLPCKQGVKGSNPFISTLIVKRVTHCMNTRARRTLAYESARGFIQERTFEECP